MIGPEQRARQAASGIFNLPTAAFKLGDRVTCWRVYKSEEEVIALMAKHAAAEVELAVAEYRKTIKLMIGTRRGVEWDHVPDSDVDSWLDRARGGR